MFSAPLMQQVINYLVTKPWNEVNSLLLAIDSENKAAQQPKTEPVPVPVAEAASAEPPKAP